MNTIHHSHSFGAFPAALLIIMMLTGGVAGASEYRQSNLVSDLPGVAAYQDANLVNPWGIAYSATGPFWIADNHTGLSTVYDSSGVANPLVVTIAPPLGGAPPAAPTGLVYNPTASFDLGAGMPARFIFSTEDGTISGWNPTLNPTESILKVDNSAAGSIYKGLAIAPGLSSPLIYASDFHNGVVNTFDSSFNPATLSGNFTDPNIPAGFAPFGIHLINNEIYVTYALQDAAGQDDVPGPGNGYVDIFDTDGMLVRRLISQGNLNSPWAVVMAPANFGDFSNKLLVGNFGDGKINAYDPTSGAFLGTVSGENNQPIVNLGLWALTFGNGAIAGPTNVLFFTAGIPGDGQVEDHGLFGSIRLNEGATPVLVSSFGATAEDGNVLLRWEMFSDVGAASFHIYRTDDHSARVRLTRAPIGCDGGECEYRDDTVEPGQDYSYEVAPVVSGRESEPFGPVHVSVPAIGRLSLRVGPSPMVGGATALFVLPNASTVRVSVFDVGGREVNVIAAGEYGAGTHRVDWNGSDAEGQFLPSGLYFVRIRTANGARSVSLPIIR
jgi:uncharacterized protein (TIGR03118 family)